MKKLHQTVFVSVSAIALIVATEATSSESKPATVVKTQNEKILWNLPAQPLASALINWSERSNYVVLAKNELTAGLQAKPLNGAYTALEALNLILKPTGLSYKLKDDQTLVLIPPDKTAFQVDPEQSGSSDPSSPRLIRVAQAEGETATDAIIGDEGEENEQDVIIVTGTNIRGIAPDSSPTRTYTREDIQITGAATAQDFIQTLPANFAGGSNLSTSTIGGVPNDDGTFFNNPAEGGSAGSSVNLRGLGSGSTLVLLNGHRMAPSSGIGDFVDISMIPASALERVEVLTDGASSIYGSDAVAGVINFILRDDFDGAEASLRYGTVTHGDMDEYSASLTAGYSWDTGNALAVYEYFSKDNLSAGDRSFSQGVPLPTDLLPSQRRHSVLASASQEMAKDFELFADFTFSTKEINQHSTSLTAGMREGTSRSKNWNASAGGSWNIGESWFLDFSSTYSKLSADSGFSSATTALMRRVDSYIWATDAKASGSVFAMPGGDVKLALGGHYRTEDFSNTLLLGSGSERSADRDVYAVYGEAFIPIIGPDNTKPGFERLEINASGRFDHFSDFGSTVNPKVGVLWSPLNGLNFRGSYSTSFNPPPLGRVGASDFTGLAYPTAFINTFLGLTPGDPSIADVVGLSLNGTSKALNAENSRAFTGGVDINKGWRHHQFTVKSTYFDIKFEDRLGDTPVPDATVFFNVPNIAFNNPELFPDGTVIFFPTMDQIDDVLNSLDAPVNSLFGADPLNAEILLFANLVRNLSLTYIRGIDFELGYTVDSDVGAFSLGLDGTFLIDFQQQAAVTTPKVELLNTQFNPVDLTLRGNVGFASNGFTANVFVNYKDSYRSDNSTAATHINSWTTVDLSLTYDTKQEFKNAALDNVVLRLSVLNLFDQAPPIAPVFAPLVASYDPTNASPLGRFIAFEVTKRF